MTVHFMSPELLCPLCLIWGQQVRLSISWQYTLRGGSCGDGYCKGENLRGVLESLIKILKKLEHEL